MILLTVLCVLTKLNHRKNAPPQLHNPWRRIFIMDKCITAKNIPINESSTFNGASTGAKSAEEKIQMPKMS
jgi:hypothetical protein